MYGRSVAPTSNCVLKHLKQIKTSPLGESLEQDESNYQNNSVEPDPFYTKLQTQIGVFTVLRDF